MTNIFRKTLAAALLPLLALAGLALTGTASASDLRLVATTGSMAVLAREVGGEQVTVARLVGPDRDAHDLTARPSMIAQLRRADMVIAVGARLEEGWLPAALDGAANPALREGQPGHFEAGNAIELRETRFDPALGGHIHDLGNPHFNLSPAHMADAARALADQLAVLRPKDADGFRQRAAAFAARIEDHLPQWRARLEERLDGRLDLIAYHEEFDYFAEWLPVEAIDFIEPKPGVPPSSRHLARLVAEHRGGPGVVVHANYQPSRAPTVVAGELGWPVHALPLEPAENSAEAYFELVDGWVEALAARDGQGG